MIRAFEPLKDTKTILLTTYKRDGTPVETPVSLAFEGDHAYFRTYDKAGKAKRLRNNPAVEVAPATVAGKPTGAPIRARARLLNGDEARVAARALAGRHRVLQGFAVPLFHRLRRYRTLHYELLSASVDGEADPRPLEAAGRLAAQGGRGREAA
jgi:PPOX class probable F420-dependent enzyme